MDTRITGNDVVLCDKIVTIFEMLKYIDICNFPYIQITIETKGEYVFGKGLRLPKIILNISEMVKEEQTKVDKKSGVGKRSLSSYVFSIGSKNKMKDAEIPIREDKKIRYLNLYEECGKYINDEYKGYVRDLCYELDTFFNYKNKEEIKNNKEEIKRKYKRIKDSMNRFIEDFKFYDFPLKERIMDFYKYEIKEDDIENRYWKYYKNNIRKEIEMYDIMDDENGTKDGAEKNISHVDIQLGKIINNTEEMKNLILKMIEEFRGILKSILTLEIEKEVRLVLNIINIIKLRKNTDREEKIKELCDIMGIPYTQGEELKKIFFTLIIQFIDRQMKDMDEILRYGEKMKEILSEERSKYEEVFGKYLKGYRPESETKSEEKKDEKLKNEEKEEISEYVIYGVLYKFSNLLNELKIFQLILNKVSDFNKQVLGWLEKIINEKKPSIAKLSSYINELTKMIYESYNSIKEEIRKGKENGIGYTDAMEFFRIKNSTYDNYINFCREEIWQYMINFYEVLNKYDNQWMDVLKKRYILDKLPSIYISHVVNYLTFVYKGIITSKHYEIIKEKYNLMDIEVNPEVFAEAFNKIIDKPGKKEEMREEEIERRYLNKVEEGIESREADKRIGEISKGLVESGERTNVYEETEYDISSGMGIPIKAEKEVLTRREKEIVSELEKYLKEREELEIEEEEVMKPKQNVISGRGRTVIKEEVIAELHKFLNTYNIKNENTQKEKFNFVDGSKKSQYILMTINSYYDLFDKLKLGETLFYTRVKDRYKSFIEEFNNRYYPYYLHTRLKKIGSKEILKEELDKLVGEETILMMEGANGKEILGVDEEKRLGEMMVKVLRRKLINLERRLEEIRNGEKEKKENKQLDINQIMRRAYLYSMLHLRDISKGEGVVLKETLNESHFDTVVDYYKRRETARMLRKKEVVGKEEEMIKQEIEEIKKEIENEKRYENKLTKDKILKKKIIEFRYGYLNRKDRDVIDSTFRKNLFFLFCFLLNNYKKYFIQAVKVEKVIMSYFSKKNEGDLLPVYLYVSSLKYPEYEIGYEVNRLKEMDYKMDQKEEEAIINSVFEEQAKKLMIGKGGEEAKSIIRLINILRRYHYKDPLTNCFGSQKFYNAVVNLYEIDLKEYYTSDKYFKNLLSDYLMYIENHLMKIIEGVEKEIINDIVKMIRKNKNSEEVELVSEGETVGEEKNEVKTIEEEEKEKKAELEAKISILRDPMSVLNDVTKEKIIMELDKILREYFRMYYNYERVIENIIGTKLDENVVNGIRNLLRSKRLIVEEQVENLIGKGVMDEEQLRRYIDGLGMYKASIEKSISLEIPNVYRYIIGEGDEFFNGFIKEYKNANEGSDNKNANEGSYNEMVEEYKEMLKREIAKREIEMKRRGIEVTISGNKMIETAGEEVKGQIKDGIVRSIKGKLSEVIKASVIMVINRMRKSGEDIKGRWGAKEIESFKVGEWILDRIMKNGGNKNEEEIGYRVVNEIWKVIVKVFGEYIMLRIREMSRNIENKIEERLNIENEIEERLKVVIGIKIENKKEKVMEEGIKEIIKEVMEGEEKNGIIKEVIGKVSESVIEDCVKYKEEIIKEMEIICSSYKEVVYTRMNGGMVLDIIEGIKSVIKELADKKRDENMFSLIFDFLSMHMVGSIKNRIPSTGVIEKNIIDKVINEYKSKLEGLKLEIMEEGSEIRDIMDRVIKVEAIREQIGNLEEEKEIVKKLMKEVKEKVKEGGNGNEVIKSERDKEAIKKLNESEWKDIKDVMGIKWVRERLRGRLEEYYKEKGYEIIPNSQIDYEVIESSIGREEMREIFEEVNMKFIEEKYEKYREAINKSKYYNERMSKIEARVMEELGKRKKIMSEQERKRYIQSGYMVVSMGKKIPEEVIRDIREQGQEMVIKMGVIKIKDIMGDSSSEGINKKKGLIGINKEGRAYILGIGEVEIFTIDKAKYCYRIQDLKYIKVERNGKETVISDYPTLIYRIYPEQKIMMPIYTYMLYVDHITFLEEFANFVYYSALYTVKEKMRKEIGSGYYSKNYIFNDLEYYFDIMNETIIVRMWRNIANARYAPREPVSRVGSTVRAKRD